jgi:hypothetical protein
MVAILRSQLSTAASGIPFTDFARSFADGPHVSELQDRELAEKHSEWRQERWKENRQSVASHAEALIAQELDNPLRTAVSTEAVGLLELVYPGLADLPVPARFEERLPNSDAIRNELSATWPDILAALLDTPVGHGMRNRRFAGGGALAQKTAGRLVVLLETTVVRRIRCNCAFGLRRLCLRRHTALNLLLRLCWRLPLISCTKVQPRSGFHGFDANSMR